MHTIRDYILVDQNVLFGKPVCKGSRVPVQSLLWHVEKGYGLDSFIEDFPTVACNQAEVMIECTALHLPK